MCCSKALNVSNKKLRGESQQVQPHASPAPGGAMAYVFLLLWDSSSVKTCYKLGFRNMLVYRCI